MSNVVDIKPKQINRNYKQHKYTVTYVPATRKWSWEVVVITETKFGGESDTQPKAYRAAEKHIDTVLKMRGVA